jgi:hypothetical protein
MPRKSATAEIVPINKDAPARPRRATRAPAAGLKGLHPGNVEIAWDGKGRRLVIFLDCGAAAIAAAGVSATGKHRLLATTTGFAPVPVPGIDGLKLSLTAVLPPVPGD